MLPEKHPDIVAEQLNDKSCYKHFILFPQYGLRVSVLLSNSNWVICSHISWVLSRRSGTYSVSKFLLKRKIWLIFHVCHVKAEDISIMKWCFVTVFSVFIIHQDLSFGCIALKIEFIAFAYELIFYLWYYFSYYLVILYSYCLLFVVKTLYVYHRLLCNQDF